MRPLSFALFALLAFSFVSAQSRDKAIQQLPQARDYGKSVDNIKALEKAILATSKDDQKAAEKEDAKVFRLLPREAYEGRLAIRGGGAYYSFIARYKSARLNPTRYVVVQPHILDDNTGYSVQESSDATLSSLSIIPPHAYGHGSDLGFQRGKLSVGFAGANYGFLYDLGERPLDKVSQKIPETAFLSTYEPPTNMTEIRAEQSRVFHNTSYEANGFQYRRSFPAVVGHTYVLRSIIFRKSDVMVAFRVHREDTDGSLIIFWKKLKEFETPMMNRK